MFSYFTKDNKIKRAYEKNFNLIQTLKNELDSVKDNIIQNLIQDKINQLSLVQELLIDSLDSMEAEEWKLKRYYKSKGNVFWAKDIKQLGNINEQSLLFIDINSNYLKSDSPYSFVYPVYKFRKLYKTIESKINIIEKSASTKILKNQLLRKQNIKKYKILDSFNAVVKNDIPYSWYEYKLFSRLCLNAKKFDIMFITMSRDLELKEKFIYENYFYNIFKYISKKYKVDIIIRKP